MPKARGKHLVIEHAAGLATLDDRLTPAEGWRFQTRTLGKELTVTMDGKVRVAMNDLRNVYNLPPKAH